MDIKGKYTAEIIVTPDSSYSSDSIAPPNPYKSPTETDVYTFYYRYRAIGIGTSTVVTPNLSKRITLSGNFSVIVRPADFASFALFTNNHSTPGIGTVWFTDTTKFTGPMHTNTHFSFVGDSELPGQPGNAGTFTDLVTQFDQNATFYNNNYYIHKDLDKDSNPPYDIPDFETGFKREFHEAPTEIPPANKQALKTEALGGAGEPSDSGVYVPNSGGAVIGGIFIKGDSNINLDKDVGDPDNKAVLDVTQGSTTTKITIEYAHDAVPATTTVQVGSNPSATYQGVPNGVSDKGIIIYAAKGEASPSAVVTIKDPIDDNVVIQKRTKMTISGEDDIIIQDHIRYQQYNASPTLNADGYENMLGLLVWGDGSDVRIGTSAPNNLEIHGIVMSEKGMFTVDNYNNGIGRGTATLLGGAITYYYGPFGNTAGSGYGRNFIHDPRTLQGQTPPLFPTLPYFTSSASGLNNRPLWINKEAVAAEE
jgi:hypothetical protein